jgi:hypothetical protein
VKTVDTGSTTGMLSYAALLIAVACSFSCGDVESNGAAQDPTVREAGKGEDDWGQVADLSGRYIGEISIVGDEWRAAGPGREISLTFHAGQLSHVRQFEIVLELFPADAFNFASATFAALPPFATFGSGVDTTEDHQIRAGGATFGVDVNGDHALGTLRLMTSDLFHSETAAQIRVRLLSLGPRSDQRDSFPADQLNLGVRVN